MRVSIFVRMCERVCVNVKGRESVYVGRAEELGILRYTMVALLPHWSFYP